MEENGKTPEAAPRTETGAPAEASAQSLGHSAPPPSGKPVTARILARAGEAFDATQASRELHEGGLRDPDRVTPTDQSFIFADPGGNEDEPECGAGGFNPAEPSRPDTWHEGLGSAQPALDLTETPDPDIPWRARPLSPGAEPLPMGVLYGERTPERSTSPYDTEPGLFGSGDVWPLDGEPSELVLGVKFREYGSVYFFRAGKEKIKPGGRVLVESEQGLSMAEVISARRMRLPLPKIRTAEGDEVEIKPILGLAGPEDIAADADNKILASGARLFCKECIRERGLDMKLVDVEVLHDRSKIIFYFTAPARIDFRELVKDLVRNYRTRIELRQIGVRHETQMLGALGNCGMACCCRRYLRRFAPVTIKMAKEQNLFLNPAKLSGICGRLLCCLANEQENYEEFHRTCPKIGKKYQTSRGVMKVLRANLFRQSIMAVGESGEEEEFQLENWRALEPQRLDTREYKEPRPDGSAAEAPDDNEREPAVFMGEEVSEAELSGLEDAPSAEPEKERPAQREHPRPHSDQPRRDKRDGRPREGREARKGPEGQDESPPRKERGQRGKRGGQGGRPQNEGSGQSAPGARDDGKAAGQPRAEANPERGPERGRNNRPDADKSIFGLPGSKHQK